MYYCHSRAQCVKQNQGERTICLFGCLHLAPRRTCLGLAPGLWDVEELERGSGGHCGQGIKDPEAEGWQRAESGIFAVASSNSYPSLVLVLTKKACV